MILLGSRKINVLFGNNLLNVGLIPIITTNK